MKGLPRSRARGSKVASPIVKANIRLALTMTTTDAGAAGAWGTAVVGDFPDGNILLLGAVLSNIKLVKGSAALIDAFVATLAVGAAPTADATLNGAEVNIVPATAQSAATTGTLTGGRAASTGTESGVVLDNTDGSLELNLNASLPDASSTGNSSLIITGVLHLSYIVLGDD